MRRWLASNGNIAATAFLTGGTLDIVKADGADDPCNAGGDGLDGPTMRVAWDLTWGGDGGPTYAAKGEDLVYFDTLYADECGWLDGY